MYNYYQVLRRRFHSAKSSKSTRSHWKHKKIQVKILLFRPSAIEETQQEGCKITTLDPQIRMVPSLSLVPPLVSDHKGLDLGDR